MQTWFIKRMGSGIYRNTFQPEKRGLNSRPALAANLLWDLGKSKTHENQGWEKLCPSAIVLSSFSHLIDRKTEVQR